MFTNLAILGASHCTNGGFGPSDPPIDPQWSTWRPQALARWGGLQFVRPCMLRPGNPFEGESIV